MRINKKQFNKWLKSLYSEQFPQTTGTLQDGIGYCCLGVGCKVLIPEKKQDLFEKLLEGAMPDEQKNSPKWLGEINEDFSIKAGHSLTDLNDGCSIDVLEGEFIVGKTMKFTHAEIAMLLDLVYNYKALNKR